MNPTNKFSNIDDAPFDPDLFSGRVASEMPNENFYMIGQPRGRGFGSRGWFYKFRIFDSFLLITEFYFCLQQMHQG